jgi:hypothetical protein
LPPATERGRKIRPIAPEWRASFAAHPFVPIESDPARTQNVGGRVDRILVTRTPKGLCERFFEEVGNPVDAEAGSLAFEDRPEVGRIVEVAAKYGIEIPPLIAR